MSDALAAYATERGALVHYMAGETDCLALVTSLDYHVPRAPSDIEVDPRIATRPMQALFVLAPMQAPFWTSAPYDRTFAPNTWHWPGDHIPPEPPDPPLYIGEIVHYSEGLMTHMAAIVVNVADSAHGVVDLAVFNGEKKRTDWMYNIPRDQLGFGDMTWHRIRFDDLPEHHGPLYAQPDPDIEE